jgi:hypothetical protein
MRDSDQLSMDLNTQKTSKSIQVPHWCFPKLMCCAQPAGSIAFTGSTGSQPVLPRDVIGVGWNNGLKGVESTDAHLMDYEVKGTYLSLISRAITLLKIGVTGVVDKHELVNLFTVNTLPKSKMNYSSQVILQLLQKVEKLALSNNI